MATETQKKGYAVVSLEDLEPAPQLAPGQQDPGRVRLPVRERLDITAFGVNAFRSVTDGAQLVREHDETGLGATGQQELYVVLEGHAVFNIDGQSVEAPAGALVFVGDPEVKRAAVATEAGTTVLAIGGTPGQAYRVFPRESQAAMVAYNAGDFETALERVQEVLAREPDDVIGLYNAACFEARLGRADDAIEHLRRAIEMDDRAIAAARGDDDFESIREEPRFAALVA